MTRYERLRRVLILCHHCLTNIAYYRGGRSGRKAAYDTESNFWLIVSGNFLDAAVLAWCKLFASKEQHSWRRIVPAASHNAFEAELLKAVGITAAEWADYIDVMRTYRDKFLAHLDSDNIMNIPELDVAVASTLYYAEYLLDSEAALVALSDEDVNFQARYKKWKQEAACVYRKER